MSRVSEDSGDGAEGEDERGTQSTSVFQREIDRRGKNKIPQKMFSWGWTDTQVMPE